MSDYLWDRSGPPDPEVEQLERTLRVLRQPMPPPALQVPAHRPAPKRTFTFFALLAAEAAMVAVLAGAAWSARVTRLTPRFEITRLEGTPTIESRPVDTGHELGVGRWLETDANARASVDVADIGRVEIEPKSRLGLLTSKLGDYRMHLARGTMRAVIWAPPGQFSVETPSATAVDLGCAYVLTVDDDDVGTVRVTSGWVGFEWKGRESFIPAGAVCLTRPDVGPGTPHFEDSSPAFRAALDVIDLGRGTRAETIAAIDRVLADAQPRDGFTLWHLLTRVDVDQRDRVFDRLASFVPPPLGTTREAVRAGQREALDNWWNALGLGSASWWRFWKQPLK